MVNVDALVERSRVEAEKPIHLQVLLGHASPVTTARYAHLTDVTEKNSRD